MLVETFLMLVRANRKKGVIVSVALMGITSLMLLRTILFVHAMNAVPGLFKNLKERIKVKEKFNVIYFSIDNFKIVNDNYGHTYGDNLLKEITTRMTKKIDGKGVIARIGGTDFVVSKFEVEEQISNAQKFYDTVKDYVEKQA